MRIRVICDGPTKDARLRALEEDFAGRIGHFVKIVVEEIPRRRGSRNGRERTLTPSERRLLEKMSGTTKVVLDARGREWTSQEFAAWLARELAGGRRELAFLVGGPEGFSEAFRKQADVLLALSKMTLTRHWARALLLEQIYRAFTILRGYPYPR